VVRDLFTSIAEQTEIKRGNIAQESLRRDAIAVDLVVNTIG
jgi:hypothetical protein